MTGATCTFKGCDRPARNAGLCRGHIAQRDRGVELSPLAPRAPRTATASERLAQSSVRDEATDCLIWTGQVNPKTGYGLISFGGVKVATHVLAYTAAHGPVPEGMQLDHSCRRKTCVNDEHIRPRTNKQNAENVGPSRRSKTGVRGVYRDAKNGRYRVSVRHHRKHHHGGSFITLAEAEIAAIALRNRLFTNNLADRELAAAEGRAAHV